MPAVSGVLLFPSPLPWMADRVNAQDTPGLDQEPDP